MGSIPAAHVPPITLYCIRQILWRVLHIFMCIFPCLIALHSFLLHFSFHKFLSVNQIVKTHFSWFSRPKDGGSRYRHIRASEFSTMYTMNPSIAQPPPPPHSRHPQKAIQEIGPHTSLLKVPIISLLPLALFCYECPPVPPPPPPTSGHSTSYPILLQFSYPILLRVPYTFP